MAEIKSIYAPQVEADLNKVYSELEKHHKKIIEMSKTTIDFYGGKQATSPAELTKAIENYEKLIAKQKQIESQNKKLEKSEKDLQKTRLAEIKLQQDREKAMDRYEAKLQKELKAKERQRILDEKNNREYVKMEVALNNVRNKAKDVLTSMFNLEQQGKKNSAEYERLRLKSIALVHQTNILDNGIKDIDKSLGQHQREVGNYAIANQNLIPIFGRVNSALMSMGTSLDDIANKPNGFESLKQSAMGFGKAMIGFMLSPLGLAIMAIGGLFALISKNKDTVIAFDAGLKDVGKTTGLAGEELRKLGEETIKLSRNLGVVDTTKLQEYQKVAGQLGVKGVDNILKFSSALAKLEVSSDISGEEGASEIARFLTLTDGGVKNVNDFGDEIVNLGNNFAATEKEILSTALAVAQNTGVYNISRRQAIALGTALKAVGVEAELAGSTLGRTFGEINKAISTGKGLENIMRLTGKSASELKEQFKENASGVFLDFIKGLNNIYKSGGDVNKQLDNIGITAVRDQRVLGTLASKGFETLAGAMDMVNESSGAMENEFLVASTKLENISIRIKTSWNNLILSIESGEGVFSKIGAYLGGVLAQILEDLNIILDKMSINFTIIQKSLKNILPDLQTSGGLFNALYLILQKIPSSLKMIGIFFDFLGIVFGLTIPLAIERAKTSFGILALTYSSFISLLKNTVPEAIKLIMDFLNPFKKADSTGLANAIKKSKDEYLKALSEIQKGHNSRIKGIKDNFKLTKEITEKEVALSKELQKELQEETDATEKSTKAKKEKRLAIVGTVEWLEQEISKLKETQRQLSKTSDEYNAYNAELQTLIGTLEMMTKAREKLNAVEIVNIKKPKEKTLLELETDALNEYNKALEENMAKLKAWQDANAEAMINTFGMDFINNSGLTTFFDLMENGLSQFGDNWEAKTIAIMEATQEMFNFIANMQNAHFEQEYNDLARQKEISIEFAGESAEAKQAIEEEYERRRKEVQKREFKAKRSQAMFNIGIDMAQGIMRAWAQNPITAPLMTALISALGVAQIASVASQPMPEFWKGTDNSPEGFAHVGEKGRELIRDGKTGAWRLADKKSVDYLSKGSTVLTNANTEKLLNFHSFNKGLTNIMNENNIDFYPIETKLDKLTNAILSKESFRIVEDSNGKKYYSEKNGQTQSLRNSRLEIKNRYV